MSKEEKVNETKQSGNQVREPPEIEERVVPAESLGPSTSTDTRPGSGSRVTERRRETLSESILREAVAPVVRDRFYLPVPETKVRAPPLN
jgi:hypothetical protein